MTLFIIPLMMWLIENFSYIAPIYDNFINYWLKEEDPDEIYTNPC